MGIIKLSIGLAFIRFLQRTAVSAVPVFTDI